MTNILSIETSTSVCSVAIHANDQLIGQSSIYLERSHSGQLGPMVESIMRSCDLSQKDLAAVAISGGPGSYTGLRIGCSLAKGICYALDIPLIAVPTLEALAAQVRPIAGKNDLLCPMLDARRMEVYALILGMDGVMHQEVKPVILEEGVFENYLTERRVWFFGNGSDKAGAVITDSNAHFLSGIRTEARTVGELAIGKYSREEFEDVAYYEPFYLKEFQATKPKKRL